jgi:hypothetical protein
MKTWPIAGSPVAGFRWETLADGVREVGLVDLSEHATVTKPAAMLATAARPQRTIRLSCSM